ncbi:MAG: glycosyltransferase [Eubacterium sp.]|nr:glycosyltransferase [Eubacterium sp.]
MQPLITIGIASYNYAVHMKKALQEIKKQRFKDYEIIVSDDCSTDDSVSVVKAFMKANPKLNIRLLENRKNEGIIANKNKIIENCKGKYLMLCDADDWMGNACLEKIADVIYKEEPDRVLVEVAHIDENGKVIQIEHLVENQTRWGWNIFHGSVFKVEILRKYGIKIQGPLDDLYFTIEFAKYGKRVSFIREVLYYWNVHLDSAGRKAPLRIEYQELCEPFLYIGRVIRFLEKRHDRDYKKDREEVRLVALKLYYFRILFNGQNVSLKEKIKLYKTLQKTMAEVDKNYLKNDYLSTKSDCPLRPYAMNIIKLCAGLERLHLMPFALMGYHIAAKFKYFDQ